jgi:hypothetical protein
LTTFQTFDFECGDISENGSVSLRIFRECGPRPPFKRVDLDVKPEQPHLWAFAFHPWASGSRSLRDAHSFDLMDRFALSPVPVTSSAPFSAPKKVGLATSARVEAWFGAPVGYPIHLACNFESPVSEWHLVVFGEKRLGIVDLFRDIYLSLPHDGAHDTRHVISICPLRGGHRHRPVALEPIGPKPLWTG